MISRYSVLEMKKIWSEENRFHQFLKVELALLRALEKMNKIPQGTASAFSDVQINPERINEIEKVTRHDVIAFCTSITEQVPEQHARFFHFGVTSSDILDTALTLQLRDSVTLLMEDLRLLNKELSHQIEKTKTLLTMGRSHGMYAEPMIFAQKFLSFHQEIQRRLTSYLHLAETELTGQLSGAVGNYTILDAGIEMLALKDLQLKTEIVSTQVIPRDHIAKIVAEGAMLAVALERMAVEFRLLHHSDVHEVQEGFKPGQKGSSTMPHKKNPISSENITGISRLIRSHVDIALENCVLWHERDISHSSTERIYLPDHFELLSYAVRRMTQTVRDLEINTEEIEVKAINQFKTLSSYILHEMILLNPVSRESLYGLIQEASFQSHTPEEFHQNLSEKARVKDLKLPPLLSGIALKAHYQERFTPVLNRSIGLS
jgi:adenylosuccinate lyase